MVISAKKLAGMVATAATFAPLAAFPRPAAALELLTNGNFEAPLVNGYAPGWTHFEQAGSIGQFYLDAPGTTLPVADPTYQLDTPANTLTPGGGTTYAISFGSSSTVRETGAATHGLSQGFALPGNAASLTLRYQFFARDYFQFGEFVDPAGLDYTASGNNQHARIDILRGGASAFSTNPADIVRTVKQPFARSNNENWENGQINLAGDLQAGQNYTLRFAVVTNREVLAVGIDNISLDFVAVIPETNTVGLMLLPLLLGGAVILRRQVARRMP